MGERRKVDPVPLGTVELRHQVAIGECRCVAKGKAPTMSRDETFERGKALIDPARDPRLDLGIGRLEVAADRVQDAEIVERVNVAGDERRHRADDRRVVDVAGKQRRGRPFRVDPFENGGAFDQDLAVMFERGDEMMRRDLHIGGVMLFAGEKIDRLLPIGNAFEPERDTDAVGGARAPEAVKEYFGHGARRKAAPPRRQL